MVLGGMPRSTSSVYISGAKLCMPVSPAPTVKMSPVYSFFGRGQGAWSVET